jgi:hypothetical protein
MTNKDREFFDKICGNLSEGLGLEYNLFCCDQAIIISESLKTKERIVEFNKATWEIQKKMVPSISDDHSGNTFGMSCRLAIAYIPMIRDNRIDEILN